MVLAWLSSGEDPMVVTHWHHSSRGNCGSNRSHYKKQETKKLRSHNPSQGPLLNGLRTSYQVPHLKDSTTTLGTKLPTPNLCGQGGQTTSKL
jgi:hypothetical protein